MKILRVTTIGQYNSEKKKSCPFFFIEIYFLFQVDMTFEKASRETGRDIRIVFHQYQVLTVGTDTAEIV